MMRQRVSYEAAFWSIFLIGTTLFILDRFTTNAWSRQSFSTAAYKTGSDSVALKEGPWTVKMYDIIARVSGRYTMSALNALFFSMMKTSHQYLAESEAVCRHIDFSDETASLRIHGRIGISLCVLTVVHVWSILFPVFLSRYSLQILPGTLSFPLSERKPAGFADADAATRMISMQLDDVYRLILMSILLGPLMVHSVKKMATDYRLGIRLHQFIMLLYFIDIVRRHTHPHSWVLNVPVFFAWLADYAWGLVRRGHVRVDVETVNIGPEYVALFWRAAGTDGEPGIGDIVHLNHSGQRHQFRFDTAERKHPFTSLARRSGRGRYTWTKPGYEYDLEFRVRGSGHGLEKVPPGPAPTAKTEAARWDRCLIVRTYTSKHSLTRKLRTRRTVGVWGAFPTGAMTRAVRSGGDVLMVAGGSGCGYILDALHYLAHHAPRLDARAARGRLLCVLTTHDVHLVRWWSVVLADFVAHNRLPASREVRIRLALTGGGAPAAGAPLEFRWGSLQRGRIDLGAAAAEFADRRGGAAGGGVRHHVFCQGGSALQCAARRAARAHGFYYHEAHSFDNARASPAAAVTL
eukprot:CAMPEP_0194266544 /NCGR_PEP_ID=MMETSP0169-20130528/1411_1 /TAXON_ID=218684 /ORGANISM="Corethron pennatum, Strain L29A3" /LENGTH=575 /DNA_ID=CAMNT_0039007249 /DNA_START=163 /DNA_END=1890 /DNA_ORIENTATION=-